jgi:hypothetical protein
MPHTHRKATRRIQHENGDDLGASPIGTAPVALPPRYQLPISVRRPSCVSMAAARPMLDMSLRKAPK